MDSDYLFDNLLQRPAFGPTPSREILSKCRYRSAAQVEFVVMIGDEGLHPLQRRWGSGVSGILFLKMLSPAIVGKRPNSS